MSNWIPFDAFVDRVRRHHHDGFTGLITGVSDAAHSFQIGFERGAIVLLTYRIRKGEEALRLLTRIERARIVEHPNREFSQADATVPDTATILSRLTAHALDDTGLAEGIDDFAAAASPPAARPAAGRGRPRLSAAMRETIESAAVHHFGPIGAMVCHEHIDDPSGDVRKIMLEIAHEVGASEADTRAFIQSVTGG